MDASWQAAAARMVADLRTVFGARLQTVVAYGIVPHGLRGWPLATMALVDTLGADDLDACARLSASWKREGLATPLLLSRADFDRSLDAFPLEYGEIVSTHHLLWGTPLGVVPIDAADIRRAVEHQAKSHLVHLREGYIEAGGHPQAVAALVAASARPFVTLLRQVAGLAGVAHADRRVQAHEGAELAGLARPVVGALLDLEHAGQAETIDPARLFPEYLHAVEQLSTYVDRLEP
jgi:hypothetical protein